jgi:predicted nucleic-acid-binding protein
MNRSKLIPILKSFSKDEIREFDKFLDSPFFGCKKFVLNFYREIINYYPEFKDKDIAKDKIFKKLYGEKKYNDALVRRIISDLIRFSEEYMAYKNFRNRKTFRNTCLLNELRVRDLEDQFRIRSEGITKKINSSESVHPDLLLETYFTKLEIKEFRTSLRDSKMHKDYIQSVEAITVYFMRLIYSYINHRNTFLNEYDFSNGIIDLLLRNLDLYKIANDPVLGESKYLNYLKMTLYVYNIVNNKDDRESYYKLMDLITNNPGYYSNVELKNIYISIIKFYNYQNDNFDNIFIKEKYSAYRLFLTDFLTVDPSAKLQLSFCRNYINLSRQSGMTEQIRELHKKYSDYLPEEHKEDLIALCEAVYFFEKKKFSRSLQFVSAINLDKEVFKLDIKILKIKNFYELGYFDSVNSELDNLNHLLNSSEKLNQGMLNKSKNYSKSVRQLTKIKTGSALNKVDHSQFMKKLENEKIISEKNWLINKLSELI